MDLETLKTHWDAFGERDPFWAILTVPGKENGKWNETEFFQTGEDEISSVLAFIESLGRPLNRRMALDFGCGVGRLTQALCRHFDHCRGIDIAPSMVRLARKYNQYPERCDYLINNSQSLDSLERIDFDFIYSSIVLQHIEPVYGTIYIKELLRRLAPQGILVFQMPSEPVPAVVPEAVDPLPRLKARLFSRTPIKTLEACTPFVLSINVTNMSEVAWAGNSDINLGNHWLDENGRILIVDDGRATLPRTLKPGEDIDLELSIRGPASAGTYLLELDMVQEHVAWFKDRGSMARRIRVEVTGRYDTRSSTKSIGGDSPEGIVPRMEMYGIPKEELLSFLVNQGGQVIAVRENQSAGPCWRSYQYFVVNNI